MYLTTVQDYVKTYIDKISFYNSTLKKRHRVSLAVPTDKRDSAKSKRATFANFIHQIDAEIACNFIKKDPYLYST